MTYKAKFLGETGWGNLTHGETYVIDTRIGEDGNFWLHRMGRNLTFPYSSKEAFLKDWEIING